jgi:adenosine deaminase
MDEYRDHPLKRYDDLGIPVTINTDNRLMSRIDLTHEFEAIAAAFSFSETDVRRLIRNGVETSFAPKELKESLRHRIAALAV